MYVNADFAQRVSITSEQYQWAASPQGGVERMMLDRLGAEKARATSLVRYAPGSRFPPHEHPGGEEILVLSGTFSDEMGNYPAGWYLRNPPGSSHQPFSREGATIFVKLWQMPPDETRQVRVDTGDPAAWRREEEGREVCPLFSSAGERVCLQRLAPRQVLPLETARGAELLVLSGEMRLDGQAYREGSWVRLPMGESPEIAAGDAGVTCYLKAGHLATVTEAR
jgi:anti-sigma factor ChrR (cupin superfamily)